MALPRFIDNNFALSGQHTLRLRAPEKVSLSLNGKVSAATADGEGLLSAKLKDEELNGSSFAIRVHDPNRHEAVAVADPLKSGEFIVQQIKEVAANPPRRLVVVVDGSKGVSQHVDQIKRALTQLPSQIETKILLAGDDGEPELLDFAEGLNQLKSASFKGGRDNLQALVKAAEFAGESKGGAVVWIHGPQPGFNNEMYIMAPYAVAPRFFELPLDDCWTDANELFRNHKEIGPFTAIVRNANVQDDLRHFFKRWQPGSKEIKVALSRQTSKPSCPIVRGPQAAELGALEAYDRCIKLFNQGLADQAANVAVAHRLITPVTGAVVLEMQSDYQRFGLQTNGGSANGGGGDAFDSTAPSAPTLQGATNASLGAQGSDATVIMGINTAATCRVNNLANLEALCNLVANSGEILGIGLGAFNMLFGALGKTGMFGMSPKKRIVVGALIMIIGLAMPGAVNWLIASARDANLFD